MSTDRARSNRSEGEGRHLRDADADAVRWYACYTRARHEKRVEARLEQRGFTAYLPVVVRVRQWHDRKKEVPWPMFPGYVFVRFRSRELYEILSTPGVVAVVSIAGSPVPIPPEDIENVRRFAEALNRTGTQPEADPEPLVEEGQAVSVVTGPFKDIQGRVLERRGRGRVLLQVGLRAVGQGLKVEVEEDRLEAIEES